MRRFIEGKNEVEVIRKVRSPSPVPPSFRVPSIDSRIDDAVMAALLPDRDKRPPTAQAFETLLRQAVGDEVVGPAHVAELLRVFVRDELSKSAQSLPADIAGPLVEAAKSVTPLPGEDETTTSRITDETRSQRLTMGVAQVSFDGESAPPQEVGRDEPTVGAKLNARPSDPDVRPTVKATAAVMPELPRYGADDEERTMEASGHELAEFLERIRRDSAADEGGDTDIDLSELESSVPRPAQPAPTYDAPATIDEAESVSPAMVMPSQRDQPTDQLPKKKPSGGGLGWLLRVMLITFVAFAVGAGVAVAYVRYLR